MEMQRVYVRFRGRVIGPFAMEKAMEMARRGQITRQHEISPDGQTWQTGNDFPELFGRPNQTQFTAVESPSQTSTVASTELTLEPERNREPNSESTPSQWYAHFDGENQGPADEATMRHWIILQKVRNDTLIWRSGMSSWLAAAAVSPQWFTQNATPRSGRQQDISVTVSNVTTEEVAQEIVRPLIWIQFIGIVIAIAGSFQAISSFASFLFVLSRSASVDLGPTIVFWLVGMAVGTATFISGVLLLRHGSAVGAIRYQPNLERILVAQRRLSIFWKFNGIFLLVWLSVIALLLFLFFVLGLKFSQLVATIL